MSWLEWLKGFFANPAAKFVYQPIDATRVDDGATPSEAMKAGEHYFQLYLSEIYLKDDMKWFQQWYPVVHSLVKFQFGETTNKIVELPHVAGDFNIPGFDQNNLQKVLGLNYAMTPLTPFRGGTVDVTAGLLAMQGSNVLRNVMGVLGEFSKLLVVPQLSAALAIAGPIVNGLQTLVGNNQNGTLHLGFRQTFTEAGGNGGNDFHPGYIAVIAEDETQIKRENLWVKNDQLRYGSSLDRSQQLTGVTYMLFRIESRVARGDFRSLTNIIMPYNEAIKALGDMEPEKADSLLRAALVAALTSDDLTRVDRIRVVKALKEDYAEAKNQLELRAVGETGDRFESAMAKAITAETAVNEELPTFEQLHA